MIRYGAKALPGRWLVTLPECSVDGALIVGDAAGFLNSLRLKGIHLAMKTGMLAAETAFEAIEAGDTSAKRLARSTSASDGAGLATEMRPVRNVHQSFRYGLFGGLAFSGLSLLTRGWWIRDPIPSEPGQSGCSRSRCAWPGASPADDGQAGSRADVRQADERAFLRHAPRRGSAVASARAHRGVSHDLRRGVRPSRASGSVRRTSMRLCRTTNGEPRLQINASNCVHCKTCDIMDPYQVITWVPPEGGGGPQYEGM